MKVSVVIPNYNGLKYLEPLMKQLSFAGSLTSEIDEVLVVDNGSRDGSVECAERLGGRVIRLQENQGFSIAVNRGIRPLADGGLGGFAARQRRPAGNSPGDHEPGRADHVFAESF